MQTRIAHPEGVDKSRRAAASDPAGALKRTKTATAPVLTLGAYVRAPSIGRTKTPRPVCEAARSAAADSPCLGSGSAAKPLVRPCIGRLSVAAGTARARGLRQLAAACGADVLPTTSPEAGRALGPVLPPSARERWPFFVLRDSRRAALPDQPGLSQIGSDLSTGGSCRHPCPIRLLTSGSSIAAAGAVASCAGVPLSGRTKGVQNAPRLTPCARNGAVLSCSSVVVCLQAVC